MDIDWLKHVQSAGWHIAVANDGEVIGQCRGLGCTMRAKLRQGTKVPEVCTPVSHPHDIPVTSYEEIRLALKKRREELALVISEVEAAAGAATDHFAKCEKEDSVRIPNVMIVMEWAQALGMEFVLRPASLPAVTLREIADTRKNVARRRATAARLSEKKARA